MEGPNREPAGAAISILLVLLTLSGSPLPGAEPEDESGPEEPAVLLEEVEVLAAGPEIATESIDPELLESGRFANLSQIVETIAGVAGVRRSQNAVEPVIRGLGWERVQTQVNGLPLHGACPARMDPPASLLPTSAVRELSVVRGLSSVTLGPGGTGGRIVISTDHDRGAGAGRETAPWAHLAYCDARNGPSLGAGVSGGTENLDYSAGLEHLSHGDYSSAAGVEVPAGEEATAGFFSVGHRSGKSGRWHAGALYQKGEEIDYPSLPMDGDEIETRLLHAGYRYRPVAEGGPFSELTLRVGVAGVDHVMSNRDKPNRPVIEAETGSSADSLSAGLASRWLFSSESILTAGADFTGLDRDALRRRRVVATDTTYSDRLWPDASQDDLGLFAEHSSVLGHGWHLRAGVRHDRVRSRAAAADGPGLEGNTIRDNYVRYYGGAAAHTDRDESLYSGNLLASRDVTRNLTLQAGIGRVSRAASVTERYFSFAPGPNGFVVGNPSLEAEHKREFSIGASLRGETFDGSLTAYRYSFDDYINLTLLERRDVNGDGVTDLVRGFVNVDATLVGAELSAVYRPTRRLSFPALLAWVRGENDDSNRPLAEIPPLEGHLAARWRLTGRRPGWIELGARFVDDQDRIDETFVENETPGFAVWHLRSRFRASSQLDVEIGIENLLDKEYHEHLTREAMLPVGDLAPGDEIPQPGRFVFVSARLAF